MNSQKLRTGLFVAAITVASVLVGHEGMAQGIDSTAKKVGNKTASIAVKGTKKLTDKTYKGKEGPGGQTVFIDKNDKKYYVDEKGKKVYLTAAEIHDKPKKD
jgi:DNA-binding beta-propeller fold protein YncE